MNKIFPIEIMKNSVEVHRYRHLRKSRVIFAMLLSCLTFFILLMLFVHIDLYATSPGIIYNASHSEIHQTKQIEAAGFNNNGSRIYKNSRESNLKIECLVSPSEVGLLTVNDPVNFQIDGFPFEQWGMANGKILHISDDASMIKGKPKYMVICSLHKTSLLHSKNTSVHLKRGMTLRAKFKITQRTVFQLLFDKIDDFHSLS